MIPAILQSASNGYLLGQGGYRPRDICVSAPTGSGKTLAFVIPIVQVSLPLVKWENSGDAFVQVKSELGSRSKS